MPLVEIRALDVPDAIILAERLLKEEDVEVLKEGRQAILERLVHLTDCVPFYIEAVCSRLGESEGPINIRAVDETVQRQLTSDHDPWEMEHFRERLGTYYSGTIKDTSDTILQDEERARVILDHMAVVNTSQSIDEVWDVVKSNFSLTDRNHIVEMLRSLALDHYLVSDTEKRYSFRFPLIQGWWKIAQGLER